MRIGVVGGTFNPIHNAHLIVAEMALEQYKLNRIIFITGGNPPHKEASASPRHRFNMTHIAIENNAMFFDDDFEIQRSEKSYTVNTLKYLKDKYPSDELFFIIGEDSLQGLSDWYMPSRILEMAALLVFPRESEMSLLKTIDKMKERYGGEILPIYAPIVEISSTMIRERISNGKTVRYMLPDCVLDYISKHNLYGYNPNADVPHT